MEAKEIFEKLYYEQDSNSKRIRYFNEKTKYYVVFFLEYRIYTIGCSNANEDVGINIELHNAINKQVEELGWLEDVQD